MTDSRTRILVIEDDDEDFLILRKLMEGLKRVTCKWERVRTYSQALEKLVLGDHEICLLDYRLEGRNGLELLREAGQKGTTIPFIFLTGLGEGDLDIEAMRLGAADFLHKDKLTADNLERSIRYSLERRKAEESRYRLAAIVESSNDAIYLVSLQGTILNWNPGAQRTYGHSAQEAVGKALSLLVPEHRQDEFPELLKSIGLGQVVPNFQTFHRDKEGKEHFLSLTISPVRDSAGKVIYASIIARDLTEDQRARALQETLRDERDLLLERLQLYLEKMPLAFILTDSHFNYSYWNPAAEAMFGYSFDEVEGKQGVVIGPHGMETVGKDIRDTILQGKSLQRMLIPGIRKDGTKIQCEWYLTPIKDEDGRFSGLMTMVIDITARLEAEKGLVNSEERFRSMFQESPIGIGLMGDGARMLMVNPSFSKFIGYSVDELLGRSFLEITHPEDGKKDLEIFQQLMVGSIDRYEVEKRFLHKEGREVWGRLTATLIWSQDEKPLYVLGMVADITEKRKSEETQKRLVAILEQTTDAVVAIGLDGKVTDWNRGAELLYGYSASEVVGTIPSFLPEGYHHEMLMRLDQETQKGKSFFKYEARRRRKDGNWVDVEANFSSLKDVEGRQIGFSVIARDITGWKKSEGVRSQLAAILQQTSDAVVGTDLEGNVFSWNRGAENLFGYNLEEILGRAVGLLAPEDRKHESMELRAIVQAGENISNFETVRINKDGQTLDVSVSMSPIHDSVGKMIGVSSIHRDISERKKAEESLRQHEEQLRQVEKMNAIGRLAGGVAHDFNNLLSVIGGNAEFLKTSLDPNSPSQDEVLEIQKAVQRGADLAKQLLVFGQRQVSQPQPVNLNEVSADMKKMLKRLIDANVELAIIQDPAIRPILADPGQIQQIILNLVINARDAMPQGGNLILETKEVKADHLESEGRPTLPIGDFVRFAVTDTGIGMTPEVQRHIFEPFFTTKAGKGTGLGLATVYTLVHKWSGHIFVHSSAGIGTTFTLYFPAMVSVEGFEEKPKQASLIPVGNETILLAEDEDQLRKVVVRSLERYGYKVLSAPNGLEAVKVAWDYKETIHLLLTDTIMPKMNGRELMVEVKKTRPKIKVIFVSGYPKEVLSQQGILESGIHLVQKPFELEEMVQQVRRILDEK